VPKLHKESSDKNRVNFSWLVRLRWGSILGQCATIACVYWLFDVRVPLLPLSILIALEALSNLVCQIWLAQNRHVKEAHLALVMAIDIALLTGLLYFTGGPRNPFSFLYLVNIALAAVALQAVWTWALVCFSLLSVGILPLFGYRELPTSHLSPSEQSDLLQSGSYVAFGVASLFIVHFLWRVTKALSAREQELNDARARAARQDRLASLAAVAAGAAHELSTPLGTIALIAGELERTASIKDARGKEDVKTIREQVARCREILDQMAGGSGKSSAQQTESITVGALLADALVGIREQPGVELVVTPAARDAELRVPPQALAQVLRALITNAQDASSMDRSIGVSATLVDHQVTIEVRDRGCGMSMAELARAGEPFYTTKEPGRGMGLGLYLARAVIERLGGSLDIFSRVNEGTEVYVRIPEHAQQSRQGAA
jgi:two-component system sensor histidine kinase RegB